MIDVDELVFLERRAAHAAGVALLLQERVEPLRGRVAGTTGAVGLLAEHPLAAQILSRRTLVSS